MPPFTPSTALQIVMALGLLNVWLLRASAPTPYRGSQAGSLRQELAAYGLPPWFFYVLGFLKVGAALCLLAGLWMPSAVLPAAALLVVLMLGAVAMHLRVKDPAVRSLPALAMLSMGAVLVGLQLT